MPRVRLTWPYGCRHIAMIAGSWSSWQPQVLFPLKMGMDELWSTEIQLPDNVEPTVYRYKFIVDGDWVYDAAQPTICNAYDSFDNYIQVSSS